ncbi:hypothetical protein [Opitutus terrae]|uniref:Uncharacterized protein n=1 Tax=Opitutus terrae (strain DSM 11246 / JCM 15787 / PB90-1) TaxID=452637 RepID=B1ZR71_OPITP|nr:hypothetical protein [Opitutus terrae]ACB74561.1 hypothetical protein Oter_1276 [Opitutus terrae PB90-1]
MKALIRWGLAIASGTLFGRAAEPPATPAAAALAALEARAAAENTYPNIAESFQCDLVRLVESNTLSSGEEFYRAARLAPPLTGFREVRVEYELMLTAVAKDHLPAEATLPAAWDSLQQALGRPLRFDAWQLSARNPDNEQFSLEAAPKVIRGVWQNPAIAREAAKKTEDNAEVKAIVDADQAARGNWSKLSQDELLKMAEQDQQRNKRIRAIVSEGGLHTAEDFARAALVMQHSSGFAGYRLAHELAISAMLLGDRKMGRWLVAATYDRMLNSVGHVQRFGTQGRRTLVHGSQPVLDEVDERGICDGERQALGCPTLAEKRANFATRRAKTP